MDKILDFSLSESDNIALTGLLTGDPATNTEDYIDIITKTKAGVTSTELRISADGEFTDGVYQAKQVDTRIQLIGVDLFAESGQSTEAGLTQYLVDNGHLSL